MPTETIEEEEQDGDRKVAQEKPHGKIREIGCLTAPVTSLFKRSNLVRKVAKKVSDVLYNMQIEFDKQQWDYEDPQKQEQAADSGYGGSEACTYACTCGHNGNKGWGVATADEPEDQSGSGDAEKLDAVVASQEEVMSMTW
jgi:hypothetical protein